MAIFPKLQTGLDVNVKFNRYVTGAWYLRLLCALSVCVLMSGVYVYWWCQVCMCTDVRRCVCIPGVREYRCGCYLFLESEDPSLRSNVCIMCMCCMHYVYVLPLLDRVL